MEHLLHATSPRAGSSSLVPEQLRAGAYSPGEGTGARKNQATCIRVAPKASWGQGGLLPRLILLHSSLHHLVGGRGHTPLTWEVGM